MLEADLGFEWVSIVVNRTLITSSLTTILLSMQFVITNACYQCIPCCMLSCVFVEVAEKLANT